VAEHGQTLLVPERAASHPRFRLLSEAGDEPYESFLGVPVYRGGAVTGVLAVQNVQPRRFRRKEVAWLECVSRRLGVLLATTVEPAAGLAR
jgi:phosphotransferase system enzyme I (PtsP)